MSARARLASAGMIAAALLAILAFGAARAPAAYVKVGQFNVSAPPRDVHFDRGVVWVTGRTLFGDPYISKHTTGGALLDRWLPQGASDPDFPLTPTSITTDSAGRVIVADYSNVYVFQPDGDLLWALRYAGARQTIGVGADSDDNIYFTDGFAETVVKYRANGTFATEWKVGPANTWPYDIAVDRNDRVYVAQGIYSTASYSGFRGVYKYSASGGLLKTFNDGRTEYVAVDRRGNVFSDYGTLSVRIQAANGAFRDSFGTANRVAGLAVDPRGTVYVGDSYTSVVHKYAPAPPSTPAPAPTPAPTTQPSADTGSQQPTATPQRPKLKRGPKGKTRKRKAVFVFRFRSPSPGARFQCKLTGKRVPKKLKRWRRCRSPKRYRKLKPGKKVFRVRAIDAAGRKGKPDTRKWRVLR